MSTPTALHPHQTFIKEQLPAWLTQAPAELRKAFRDSLISSNQSRHAVKTLLDTLKSPEDFARPLLREKLKTRFFHQLKEENAVLVREWKNHHLLGLIRNHARTTRQTLLEAALQNFEASEAQDDGMEAGTGLYNVTKDAEVLSTALPTAFAGLCRELDVGGQYLKHIQTVLEPTVADGITQPIELLRTHEQQAFGVALHMASMQKLFTPSQYEQLHDLQRNGSHPDIRRSHLSISKVLLPNVLVFQAPSLGLPYLLYTAGDPGAAFRHNTTMESLQHNLAERLESADYLAFFEGLVPLQHQGTLLTITPRPSPKARPSLANPVGLAPIPNDVFRAMAQQRIAQIKNDARALAVPTADADLMSRQKRLQGYLDLGKSLLFFAASFIPVVGEVLLVVSAAQLIGTVYDGFAAWSRGDSDEALNDLLDVVDNVALAAATAGVVKTARFTFKLVKVQVARRGPRLWNPDLTPYRHAKALPASLLANSRGLYQHEQQHYLKLDDQVHAAQPTPDAAQWQLTHPSDPHAYSPPLMSNGVGGWRSEHENPQDWDNLKLIKRLGPDAANITQPAVEPILLLSGVDQATLRQSFQDMVRPPPLLRSTVQDFNLDQEINDFDLDRAEGKTVSTHSPLIQFHLLSSLPEWPADYRLNIIDEQKNVLISHGTGPIDIDVQASRFRNGGLLHALEQQLPQEHFNRLLPTLNLDYLTKTENLAMRLQEQAQQHKQRLFASLSRFEPNNHTPAEQELHTLMPDLSKSHLEEMGATLSEQEQLYLTREKNLTSTQHAQASEYTDALRANRAKAGIHLDSRRGPASVPLVLHSLEKTPGWPGSRKIDIYDDSNSGPLLGSIGGETEAARHILIRQGEQYAVQDDQGLELHAPSDLFSALEHTLSKPEHEALLSQSNAGSLKHAVQQTALKLMAKKPPCRAMRPVAATVATQYPLDPLFAEPALPLGTTQRADGIYQSPPLPDGSYRYYIPDNGNYYRINAAEFGWQLIDARSPFRAYRPYVRSTLGDRWEIDPAKGALRGGMHSSQVPLVIRMEPIELSDEFESAQSSSEYDSAEEGSVTARFTPQELKNMRTKRNYQYNQNYRRIYDRANNGRYPLRNLKGEPMRIRKMQVLAKSLTSNATFNRSLLTDYIEWEGYERVARHYEDKLEVRPFTADLQKHPEESALLGQATVITRKPIPKGEALGVYGGELVPEPIASFRQDPYLLDITPPTAPRAIHTEIFSGDNALSRINTIFEYEAGQPVRQAATGYNVETARFLVETQVNADPRKTLSMMAFFASEDIPAATELRWNYQYNEATVRALFGPLPNAR